MRWSSACALLLGALGVTATRPAGASPAARLVYARSPEASSCPDESVLRRAVAARFGYDPFFAWAKQTVIVQVWREHGKYLARLQLIDDAGLAHGTRELSSRQRDCAELFDAAALALSIALDSLPKEDTPVDAPAPATGALAAPGPALAPEPMPTPVPALAPAPAVAALVPDARVGFEVGLDTLASEGLAPAPAIGVAAFLGARRRWVSAAVELRADAPASSTNDAGIGVRSNLYAATLVPCIHVGPALFCVLGGVGLVRASSFGLTDPRTASAVLVTAGARAGLEWPISRALSVGAHLDAVFDLRRPTFDVDGWAAWTAPVVAATGGVGLRAHFP